MILIGRGTLSKRSWNRRRRRPTAEPEQPQRGFTPYECVQIFWLYSQGITQQAMARGLECSQSTISRAIKRGRDTFHSWDLPRMLVVGWDLKCGHDRPIQVGDRVVCLRCFVSGYDEVDAMKVTASDLARIEREEFEASLPKDKDGQPIYPQEPLKPLAQRRFGTRKATKK